MYWYVLPVAVGYRLQVRISTYQKTAATSWPFIASYNHPRDPRRTEAMLLGNRVIRRVLLAVWWSTMPHIGKCAPTSGQNDISIAKDYDIHVPLSAIPLGVNVGPSLEILSFRSDEKTGELPWIARRGWLAVGDVLVSLEGENMSEVGFIVQYFFPRMPPPPRRPEPLNLWYRGRQHLSAILVLPGRACSPARTGSVNTPITYCCCCRRRDGRWTGAPSNIANSWDGA